MCPPGTWAAGPLTVALAAAVLARSAAAQGYKRSANREEELIRTPRMHEALELVALPAELDWRGKDGANYTTVSRNQHIPEYCGACYAFAATSAVADRIRILRGPGGPEVNLAVQVVLNCDMTDLGCSGGDSIDVYRFLHTTGVPEETCQPYEALGHDVGDNCTATHICKRCNADGCVAQHEYNIYTVEQYGFVKGEHQMLAELQRGPITCSISTPNAFINHMGWDIYEDPQHAGIDHVISVVGYGSEDGKPYWILRNSWGTYWGYYGWARVLRGKNVLHIEQDCDWAVPSNGGMPELRRIAPPAKAEARGGAVKPLELLPLDAGAALMHSRDAERHHEHEPEKEKHHRGHEVEQRAREVPPAALSKPDPAPVCRVGRLDWAAAGGELVLSPLPHQRMREKDLPKEWDWRNVSGRSYTTWNTNEHLPRGGCASCWAHGVASTLGDRIAVHRKGAWPMVSLSPQMLINCNAGGSCGGGDPAAAYAYIRSRGVTDETCQNYQAKDLSCDGAHICRNCAPGGEHGLVWPGHCVAVRQPIVWFVSEYGAVRGAFPMKAEIYKRGPIGCGLDATPGFREYSGGVYRESKDRVHLNQQVSLVGWGTAGHGEAVPAGTEFWKGRNSWGTYWGEDGWFRIQMHKDNLGVELDCDWAVPDEAEPVPSTMLSLTALAVAEPGDAAHFMGLAPLAASVGVALLLLSAAVAALRLVRHSRVSDDATGEHYILVA